MAEQAELIEAPAAAPADPTPATSAVAEYSATEAGLAALRARLAGVAYDLSTGKGMDIAKADRAELRTLRTSLEAKRKDLKAPIIERGKLLDEEAKRITAAIEALETPIDEQIKAAEKRKEEERKAREAAERKRVTDIHAQIAAITSYVVLAGECRTAAKVQALIDKVSAVVITSGVFQEFEPEAALAKVQALERIGAIFKAKDAEEKERARVAQEQEAERQRLAEERAALDRQRAEQARADKEAADKRAAEEKRLADERAALEQQRADLERRQAAAAVVDEVFSTLAEPAIVTGPVSAFEQEVQAMAEAIGATGTTNVPAMTHPNGAPMYSTTTFKDNGEPIMLDANGKRSVFCDIADDMPALPPVKRPSAEDIALAVAQRFFATFDEAAHWLKTTDFSTL
jgi:septal ring factor EnvC (AmiA/AmiB activator)